MPLAMRPGSTRPYVLKSERQLEKPTRFALRNLRLSERQEAVRTLKKALSGQLKNLLSSDDLDDVAIEFEPIATVVRMGLAGWQDFPCLDEDGKERELHYEAEDWTTPEGNAVKAVKRDLLDYFEHHHLVELANAIAAQNQLSETDRGNSGKPDSSPGTKT